MLIDLVNLNKQCTDMMSNQSPKNSKLSAGKLLLLMDIITLKSFQLYKNSDNKTENQKLLLLIPWKENTSQKSKTN